MPCVCTLSQDCEGPHGEQGGYQEKLVAALMSLQFHPVSSNQQASRQIPCVQHPSAILG